MFYLDRQIVFLVLQFLDEVKFKKTIHSLEKESGLFFNLSYFEKIVCDGEWQDVESYLLGFTNPVNNPYSTKIFFEIRKQKYLEALDKRDFAEAVHILTYELKLFSAGNEDLYKEIAMLLTMKNFRGNSLLSNYGDAKSARACMFVEIKKLIVVDPRIKDKLQFPTLKNSRLKTLINQSLNWQHSLCKKRKPKPEISTLFVDHDCGLSTGAQVPPVPTHNVGGVPTGGGPPPYQLAIGPYHRAPTPYQHDPAVLRTWFSGSMGQSSMPHHSLSMGPISLTPPNNLAVSMVVKRPRTPSTNNAALGHETEDSEHLLKRSKPSEVPEANNLPVNIMPHTYSCQSDPQPIYSTDALPKTVVANLCQGSAVVSMDFHPVQQTLLLVGLKTGDCCLWDLSSGERGATITFEVWDLGASSVLLKTFLAAGGTASVNRVLWSPDGKLIGVAYSKNIVHLYDYFGGHDIRNRLEIDAHDGSVNDIAFCDPKKKMWVVTCGEDKTVKVWNAATGAKRFTYEGHEAPVYSLCPGEQVFAQYTFSTSVDGKIKAWVYDNNGPRVDHDAPGHSCITMKYSTDRTRLFGCGTTKDGKSYIIEYNDRDGAVKRIYVGLEKWSAGVVQFDTAKNRILVAGDGCKIKFWDMDHSKVLSTIDADGDLPAIPQVKFNKEGSLLAVSTKNNGCKIFANAEGIQHLGSIVNRTVPKLPTVGTCDTSGPGSATGTSADVDKSSSVGPVVTSKDDSKNMGDVKPQIPELVKPRSWKLTEINEQSQLCSLKLPDSLSAVRIVRLTYTNSGKGILTLTNNGVHKIWKWQEDNRNITGKATSAVPPQLCEAASSRLINKINEANLEEAVPCFSLSKNDNFLVSASGGKITLFDMIHYEKMHAFWLPPPAPTALTLCPLDNNYIAIGMDDSSIKIYHAMDQEVTVTLKGHFKRVTGLAFSGVVKVLVSSGADSQLCVWSLNGWEKKVSKYMDVPHGCSTNPLGDTHIQFHKDGTHVLAVQESQIVVYEASKLECINQWFSPNSGTIITNATYSCDGNSIYSCFNDGSVLIFTSGELIPRCSISATAYMPSTGPRGYPVVVAAHPSEANQFALGLTDGGVYVVELLETQGHWGSNPPPLQEEPQASR